MNIKTHNIGKSLIAEIVSSSVIINDPETALELLGNIYYQGFDSMIIHEHNLISDFFDLRNRMAGEILQKFSNYRVSLAVVGDFEKFASKSLHDFIFESNKTGRINFVPTVADAISVLTGKAS